MDAAELDRIAQQERPRLIGLAYRMTGSRSDAEDIVQDALLRAHRAQVSDIESPAAYLTTITTRLASDHQRPARVRRESYVGPWPPEPIAADPAPDAAASAELADTLSMAFLVVLETLTPDERATGWGPNEQCRRAARGGGAAERPPIPQAGDGVYPPLRSGHQPFDCLGSAELG